MGYTTDFDGEVTVKPPLNRAEINYLKAFSGSRRLNREQGPYHADPGDTFGQGDQDGVIDYNRPPEGQPGLWCQWEPSEDGHVIGWDGGEKFYDSVPWMEYIIDHFLKPGAVAQGHEGFEQFSFDHTVNGVIYAQGEAPDDQWALKVKDNVVTEHPATVSYEGLSEDE